MEENAVSSVFKFTLDQMGIASANILELRNKARSLSDVEAEKAMEQSLYALQQISKQIESQRRAWSSAMKNTSRRIVVLPNYPVTPLSSYARSNNLMYKKNHTATQLSPKVRSILDILGQRFVRTRNSLTTDPTANFTRRVASVNSINALRALQVQAWHNGANMNTIKKIAKQKEVDLLKQQQRNRSIKAPPLQKQTAAMKAYARFRNMKTLRSLLPTRWRPGFML
jgi:hypothetical protein